MAKKKELSKKEKALLDQEFMTQCPFSVSDMLGPDWNEIRPHLQSEDWKSTLGDKVSEAIKISKMSEEEKDKYQCQKNFNSLTDVCVQFHDSRKVDEKTLELILDCEEVVNGLIGMMEPYYSQGNGAERAEELLARINKIPEVIAHKEKEEAQSKKINSPEYNRVKCLKCGKNLKSELGLIQHIKDKHPFGKESL